jgi:Uma2 family endonuclease
METAMDTASRPQQRLMTVAEFLEYDDGTGTRYELINGQLVAMNPPAARHAIICHNIGRTLEGQLRPPCIALWSTLGVAVDEKGDTWRQPDAIVTCVQPAKGFFRKPRLIVEVLSPATEKEDRTTKLDFYDTVPGVETILLVWQDQRRVQLRERDTAGWRERDIVGSGTVRIEPLGVELTLDEIYHDPWGEDAAEA